MYLEIYKLDPNTHKREWIEVVKVDSREEAEDILWNTPEINGLDGTLCSISAPRKSRLPFYMTSWCHFYRSEDK